MAETKVTGARERRVCVRCIMDTTDPTIWFDERGVCSHCYNFENRLRPLWMPDNRGARLSALTAAQIRAEGTGKEYDSILGLSGGADSSYLAYQVSRLGLRPLVVHVDGGWNSELAVKNIENVVKKLNLDLFTHVVDWDEMRDLQLAFFKSGVANQDTPQDHAFFAALYSFAVKNDIRYVLSGSNISTECILPTSWEHNAMDLRQLLAIHRRFGSRELSNYPRIGFLRFHVYFPFLRRMRVIKFLDWQPYNRAQAIRTLERELGWRDYGAKHCESRFTKLFQRHYLPVRFGYDKRIAHLSSLIVTGQITRTQALLAREADVYPATELEADMAFVAKKLGVNNDEFGTFLSMPLQHFSDYPSNERVFRLARDARDHVRDRCDGRGGPLRPPLLAIDPCQRMSDDDNPTAGTTASKADTDS